MLALVGAGVGVTDNPLGVHATCNAANGGITMRVGKQDVTRVGRTGVPEPHPPKSAPLL